MSHSVPGPVPVRHHHTIANEDERDAMVLLMPARPLHGPRAIWV